MTENYWHCWGRVEGDLKLTAVVGPTTEQSGTLLETQDPIADIVGRGDWYYLGWFDHQPAEDETESLWAPL